MAPVAIETERNYNHIKVVASDLDGTLIVHGINGYAVITISPFV
jgi:hydroxymethylpyrimidine pyrophosphatase-like HAD family hydrolase